jgi:bifunctional non-homologous end joining protein LigD
MWNSKTGASSRWAFEVKHDGYRFIARRDGDRGRVFSRNAKEWTDRVPTTRPVATPPNL